MIQTIKITKIDEVLNLMIEQKHDPAIQRYRSSFLYRGLPNVDYKLETSLKSEAKRS